MVQDEAGALWAWGAAGGCGFYPEHNGSPLKGLVTVNRKAHKSLREGPAQLRKPCIQGLPKHSLHCLPGLLSQQPLGP